MSPDPSVEAIRKYAELTDPRVVPVAMRALQTPYNLEINADRKRIEAVLQVFIRFPVPEAAPALSRLMRSLPSDAVKPAADLRNLTVMALANTRSEAAAPDLLAAIVDYSLGEMTRCHAAAALVELDREEGRIYLFESYRRYRQRIASGRSRSGGPFETLSQMNDPALERSIRDLEGELAGTLRNNARSIRQNMRDHHRSVDELRRLAIDNDWSRASMRYRAVAALGAVGTPHDAELLLNLKRWDVARWGPDDLQNRLIRERAVAAVNHIKRRYWREILIDLNNKGRLGGRPGIRIPADEDDFPLDVLMGEPHWVVDEPPAEVDPDAADGQPPADGGQTHDPGRAWHERLWRTLFDALDAQGHSDNQAEPLPTPGSS